MKVFKRHKALGFFDEDIRLTKLSRLGDPLERLSNGIDFDLFRETMTDNLHIEPKNKGGRRPYDYVMMFKVIILQRYYNLSEDRVEYQICDRLSFMRFLGLTLSADVPDSKTVWSFRERLVDLGLSEVLFRIFLKELERLHLVIHEGKIADAGFVEIPRQRNTSEENKQIKQGEIPQEWIDKPRKLSQKDTDARWTKKNGVCYYGCKNHAKCDEKSKLITGYEVTDASVHDSRPTSSLLNKQDEYQDFYADSAYTGDQLHRERTKEKKVKLKIIEKGYKNKPLTEEQKAGNKEKRNQK